MHHRVISAPAAYSDAHHSGDSRHPSVDKPWSPALAGLTVACVDAQRLADIRRVLDTVLDPELDEPVTALGFVTRIAVNGDDVAVDFRLPTFWCSPNFAWIMAEDMRNALRVLPWARGVSVTLADHLFAEKINAAVNAGKGFRAAFAETHGDLAQLRSVFRRRAYLGRMAALIDALREAGRSDAEVIASTIGELQGLALSRNDRLPSSAFRRDGRQNDRDGERHRQSAESACGALPSLSESGKMRGGQSDLPALAERYLELRTVYGGSCGGHDAAFRTPEGADIAAAALPLFLRGIRMTRRGMEANGEMCRIYLGQRVAGAGGRP